MHEKSSMRKDFEQKFFPKQDWKNFLQFFFLSLKKKGDEFAKNPTDKSENTAKLAML